MKKIEDAKIVGDLINFSDEEILNAIKIDENSVNKLRLVPGDGVLRFLIGNIYFDYPQDEETKENILDPEKRVTMIQIYETHILETIKKVREVRAE